MLTKVSLSCIEESIRYYVVLIDFLIYFFSLLRRSEMVEVYNKGCS